MEKVSVNKDTGQILVQVALLVGVLFAFLALALDVGHLYAQRRRMQNAADAGALAGARELCFGDEANAERAATEYAVDRNGATWATVDLPGDATVTVVASETIDTFFAGVVGFNKLDVQADATAMCGRSRTAGGLWPLAYDSELYGKWAKSECGQDGQGGQEFLVFNDKDDDKVACGTECDCEALGPHIGPGNRGWLRFFDPEDHLEDPCEPHNCGADEVNCWIDHGHPGPVQVGDCIPGNPGVKASYKKHVDGREGDIVSVVLYDRECEAGDPEPLGTCPGTSYHVAGFACVQVLGTDTVDIKSKDPPPDYCVKNMKVIKVKIMCGEDCTSPQGRTDGQPADDEDLRSVSLVK